MLILENTVDDIEAGYSLQGINHKLAMRDVLLNNIFEFISSEESSVKALSEKIRNELDLITMTKYQSFTKVGGVDAGSQILTLASRRIGLISSLAYLLPKGERFWTKPESFDISYSLPVERVKSSINIRRESKLYETACKFIKEKEGIELLLIDGPLALSSWWNIAGCYKDRQRLINGMNSLIKTCHDLDVALAGIVKRPSARYLLHNLGLQEETRMSDSFILLHVMKHGERTDIFSTDSVLNQPSRVNYPSEIMDEPIYSFYAKFTQGWEMTPVRIDLPLFSLARLDDIADYCYATSLHNGVPLPIIKADENVRITRRFMAEVYNEALRKLCRQSGDMRGLAMTWGEGKWMGI